MTDITNSDSVIDSRDVIERLEELTDERDALQDAEEEAREAVMEAREAFGNDDITYEEKEEAERAFEEADAALTAWEAESGDEYRALKAFADEAEGCASDWRYGATLIRESYFTDYCEELLKDIGDLPRDLPGYIVIDWQATADNLRADYTEVDFDGVTYLVR